jgi:hypothetical protein
VQPGFIEPGRQMWIEIWYPKDRRSAQHGPLLGPQPHVLDPPRKKA